MIIVGHSFLVARSLDHVEHMGLVLNQSWVHHVIFLCRPDSGEDKEAHQTHEPSANEYVGVANRSLRQLFICVDAK